MKRTKLYNNVARWAVALSLVVGFASCSTDESTSSDEEWVDPRYRNLEDSYTIAADGSETIVFEIKSNMEWTVYNANDGWCAITPESGDDPDTTYEVTVTYAANTSLDDRFDTLSLKSDYWVFKEVEVTQKGVAALTLDKESDFLSKEADEAKGSLTISTNQNWRVEIAEDCDWLSFDTSSATSGEGDGSAISDFTVSYSAEQNEDVQRVTTISVYDRNDDVQYIYTVTQDGLLLTTDDEFYFFNKFGGECSIPVNANLNWTVELVESAAWLNDLAWTNSLDDATGETADEITFTLSAATGDSRAVYLRLTSTSDDPDAVVITYYVGVVQGSAPAAVTTYFNDESIFDNIGTDGWYIYNGEQPAVIAGAEGEGYIDFCLGGRLMTYPSGIPYGRYDLTISDIELPSSSNTFYFYLMFDNVSNNYVGMNIDGGSYIAKIYKNGADTDSSMVYYTPAALGALIGNDNHSITDKHTLGIDLYQNEETGYLAYDWYINDVLIQSITDDTVWANTDYDSIMHLCFGSGTITDPAQGFVYSYSYTAPSEYDARPTLPEE